MRVTVFSKKKTTKEGKAFETYFGTLQKKDGTEMTTEIKFRDSVDMPDNFPSVLVTDVRNCNLSHKKKIEDDGTFKTFPVLWVAAADQWEEYVDRSLDDFITD